MEQKVKGDVKGSYGLRKFLRPESLHALNKVGMIKAANRDRGFGSDLKQNPKKAIRQSPVSKTDSVRHL